MQEAMRTQQKADVPKDSELKVTEERQKREKLKAKIPQKLCKKPLCCPLTGEHYIDPVMVADGQTYEREAIEAYIQSFTDEQKGKERDEGRKRVVPSPMTGKPLTHLELIPNIALREALKAMKGVWGLCVGVVFCNHKQWRQHWTKRRGYPP